MDRPKREFNDGGQGQNRETVIVQPTVQQVHEVEQELAHDLEHPEVHDLGLIVRKLCEPVIKLRAGVNFETRAGCLSGLQLKSRHPKRALNSLQLLVRRAFDIEMPAPYTGSLGGKRRH